MTISSRAKSTSRHVPIVTSKLLPNYRLERIFQKFSNFAYTFVFLLFDKVINRLVGLTNCGWLFDKFKRLRIVFFSLRIEKTDLASFKFEFRRESQKSKMIQTLSERPLMPLAMMMRLNITDKKASEVNSLFQDDTDEDTLLAELDKLKNEESSLHKKLEMAEKEYIQTQQDINSLKSDVKKLNEEETNLEREYATLKAELASLEEEKKSHDLEARSMESHLRKLKNLNPLAAAFHISKSKGKYGVINGLR